MPSASSDILASRSPLKRRRHISTLKERKRKIVRYSSSYQLCLLASFYRSSRSFLSVILKKSYSSATEGAKKKKNQVITPSVNKRARVQPHSSSYKWKLNYVFLVFFFFALSFWLLPLFDLHFDISLVLIRTLFRKGLRRILSRLGWGLKGPLSFLLLAQCGEWMDLHNFLYSLSFHMKVAGESRCDATLQAKTSEYFFLPGH